MQLILLRHPKPLVAAGICYGSSDVAVDPAEHAEVCRRLLPILPKLPGVLPVYASPLRRCADLAARLDSTRLQLDARLMEMHFGAWEMRPWDAIDRHEIDAWAADVAGYRPGGGETVLEMAARVSDFYTDLVSSGDATAMVVCHAGTIRLLLARQQGLSIDAMARQAGASANRIQYGEAIFLQAR